MRKLWNLIGYLIPHCIVVLIFLRWIGPFFLLDQFLTPSSMPNVWLSREVNRLPLYERWAYKNWAQFWNVISYCTVSWGVSPRPGQSCSPYFLSDRYEKWAYKNWAQFSVLVNHVVPIFCGGSVFYPTQHAKCLTIYAGQWRLTRGGPTKIGHNSEL